MSEGAWPWGRPRVVGQGQRGSLVAVGHIWGSRGKAFGAGASRASPFPWKDARLAFRPLDSAVEQEGPPAQDHCGPLGPRSLRDPRLGRSPGCPLQTRLVLCDMVLSAPRHAISCHACPVGRVSR